MNLGGWYITTVSGCRNCNPLMSEFISSKLNINSL